MTRGGGSSFDLVIREWDAHVDRCGECLTDGMNLCYEGEYLRDEVVESRLALANSADLAPPARPFRGPQRSMEASGVAA